MSNNDKIEAQREILGQFIKKLIKRIKELQKQLVYDKDQRREFGIYEDCGDYYRSQVDKTEACISELIDLKISTEKWRKKLKYELIK